MAAAESTSWCAEMMLLGEVIAVLWGVRRSPSGTDDRVVGRSCGHDSTAALLVVMMLFGAAMLELWDAKRPEHHVMGRRGGHDAQRWAG